MLNKMAFGSRKKTTFKLLLRLFISLTLIKLNDAIEEKSNTNANMDYDVSDGKSLIQDDLRHQVIKRVHKFSIGKDPSIVETDPAETIVHFKNNTIYSNVPPAIMTHSIRKRTSTSQSKKQPTKPTKYSKSFYSSTKSFSAYNYNKIKSSTIKLLPKNIYELINNNSPKPSLPLSSSNQSYFYNLISPNHPKPKIITTTTTPASFTIYPQFTRPNIQVNYFVKKNQSEPTFKNNKTVPSPAASYGPYFSSIKSSADKSKMLDLNKIKISLNASSKEKNFLKFNEVLNDIWSAKTLNLTNLNKGRSNEDTKAILNYMIMALHTIKSNEIADFDSNKFFDQVIIDPNEIMPDGLYEKDIVLSKEQAYNLFSKYFNTDEINHREKRKVIRDLVYRWPLPIYFLFDDKHNEAEKLVIRSALRRWEEETCIEFKELTKSNTNIHYMKFTKGQGCWSPIGYAEKLNYQEVTLSDGCIYKGVVLHEIGHALGFFHEQSRPDRDDYINIIKNNIVKFQDLNFQKYGIDEIDDYDVPYDLSSDMHYGSTYFSSNNQITIEPKDKNYQRTIGQRSDLSFSDIKTANKAYCKNKCMYRLPCLRDGYPNPKDCQKCLCPEGFSGQLCDQLSPSTGACGGLLTGPSGYLQTPNYPLYYPGFIKCNWLIRAPAGYRIKLTFTKLFSVSCDPFAIYGPCDQDWLEIKDNSKNFFRGGPRYCCNSGPSIVQSVDNEIMVLFRSSSGNINSNGFRATYEFVDINGNSFMNLTTDRLTTPKLNIQTTDLSSTSDDFCSKSPCLNGGLCLNYQDSFGCDCPVEFTGKICENKVSKCFGVNCYNNGMCLEKTGRCSCLPGFAGQNCNITIDACNSNPCVKGVCVNLIHSYKCFCLLNYTGERCETSLKKTVCQENTCMNNGKCIESDLYEGFVCKCPRNYHGILCEHSLCTANNNVCGDDGICVLKSEGGYLCRCSDGTISDNCRSHPCMTNICGNYGTCLRQNSSYSCKCAEGYTGKNCETKLKPCDLNPCYKGRCYETSIQTYKCKCLPGFTGKKCDIAVIKQNLTKSKCSQNPCKNFGICIDRENKFICFCPPGYVGNLCEISYTFVTNICESLDPCKNGKCVVDENGYNCICDKNWVGKNCDIADPCMSSPCLNNGVCIPTAISTYLCACPTGYTGQNCAAQIEPSCLTTRPCENGGTCVASLSDPNVYKCSCLPDFTGSTCSRSMNRCKSNPCSKNQLCINSADSYVCVCIPGIGVSCPLPYASLISSLKPFIKKRNDTIIQSPCSSNPCKNDAVCDADNHGNYNCKCKFGYTGKNCEKIDECIIQENMCKNGGSCVMRKDVASCDCPQGFEGSYCQNISIYCHKNVCNNGGTCIRINTKPIVAMKCLCKPEFTGVFCDSKTFKSLTQIQNETNVPNLCSSLPNKTLIDQEPLRITESHHENNSYYLIQGERIWYLREKTPVDLKNWPVKISNIFPTIENSIDAIIYHSVFNDYFIFKGKQYWRFKGLNNDPLKPVHLLNGYPRLILNDFGIDSIESGIFIRLNAQNHNHKNFILFYKDSKIIKFDENKSIEMYYMPIKLTPITLSINTEQNSFYALYGSRLFHFLINPQNNQINLKSIHNDMKNTFFCEPFNLKKKMESQMIRMGMNTPTQANIKKCPDFTSISSIVKLNKTTGLMLRGNKLEYLEITSSGYKYLNNYPEITLKPDINMNGYSNSMINLNRILFMFQTDIVWIYSLLNDTLVKNKSPGLFQNLFPNQNTLNSIVSSHYSPKSKKFYFFSDKFYLEYENQNRFNVKTSIKNLSAKLKNVIQNYEDDMSVYLVDENSFIYYLNLKNDYLESVDRRSASYRLFINCIHAD